MKIWKYSSTPIIRNMSTSTTTYSGVQAEATKAVTAIYTLRSRPAFSFAVSGGGMQVIPMFLGVPGASACVMDVAVPYSRAATEMYLSDNCDQSEESTHCTAGTALKLAKAAYLKTCNLLLHGEGRNSSATVDTVRGKSFIFGISCTAALVSAFPKKGDHRAHVGIYSNSPEGGHGTTYSITLAKGLRDRPEEDALCSRLILDVITKHVGLPLLPDSLLLSRSPPPSEPNQGLADQHLEVVDVVDHPNSDAIGNVTSRASKHALYFSTGEIGAPITCIENVTLPAGTLIYPGSFNPLHDGHLSLVRSQLDLLEQQFRSAAGSLEEGSTSTTPFRPPLVVFEIGAVNADKPPLPRDEITKRLSQFHAHSNPLFSRWGITNFAVSITSEPLFLGKAAIFPGCDFLIGADTMVRLINSKYYADRTSSSRTGGGAAEAVVLGTDSEARRTANMVSALSTIAARRCRFVVGGRVKSVTVSGRTESLFETCDAILHGDYEAVAGGGSEPAVAAPGHRVIDVLPQTVVDLFVNLSEEQFRLDLSSTELRNKGMTLEIKTAKEGDDVGCAP